MHRQILLACLPCLAALAAALFALRLLVRASGARFEWRRLREVHRCEQGGVQSLAFVLTLPLFLVISQFIVQVNQLMTAVMVVNYAAYASARSAAVWVPAEVGYYRQNKMEGSIAEGVPVVLTSHHDEVLANPKYQQIFKAAALACATISPSRDLGYTLDETNRNAAMVTKVMYTQFIPAAAQNNRLEARINNKIAWSWENTSVRVSFLDKDTRDGPTYNPRRDIFITLPNGTQQMVQSWDPHEIGWQDPVTCTVTHEFALLPGPGRFLSTYLVRADGQPDTIAPKIEKDWSPSREKIYTTSIWATATATVEGLKSEVPYVQMP
jgi:hypothetical protein